MSKELEAFERLCSHLDYDTTDYMFNGQYEEDDNIIETALKEWELWKDNIKCGDYEDNRTKALEIIKDCKITGLKLVWSDRDKMWFVYAPHLDFPIMYGYKKEEYELLKEILCE